MEAHIWLIDTVRVSFTEEKGLWSRGSQRVGIHDNNINNAAVWCVRVHVYVHAQGSLCSLMLLNWHLQVP